jgi:hypothetical protein
MNTIDQAVQALVEARRTRATLPAAAMDHFARVPAPGI